LSEAASPGLAVSAKPNANTQDILRVIMSLPRGAHLHSEIVV
jgi:hypothetical protein